MPLNDNFEDKLTCLRFRADAPAAAFAAAAEWIDSHPDTIIEGCSYAHEADGYRVNLYAWKPSKE